MVKPPGSDALNVVLAESFIFKVGAISIELGSVIIIGLPSTVNDDFLLAFEIAMFYLSIKRASWGCKILCI